jgi:phosphoglucomutase
MDERILEKARVWTGPAFDSATREEISVLIRDGGENELIDRFYRELEFGTGGMRGIMAPGTNRMNIYTVGRATQGLANHLLASYPDAREKGVAIAFDSRINSPLFAREAARVLAANGIRVFIFPELRPTPLLSFAVRELGARSGIVITASHNPKEYNGYKVYGPGGGQVIAPEDGRIVDSVNRVDITTGVKKIDYAAGVSKGIIEELGDRIERTYLDLVSRFAEGVREGLGKELSAVKEEAKIVYTPLHGAGITLVPKALERAGSAAVVLEPGQSVPDGSFPTTPSPNPEEPAALQRAIRLAEAEGADMVIATDPDCDRMGIAVREWAGAAGGPGAASEGAAGGPGAAAPPVRPSAAALVPLSGNQIGCLLEYLILRSFKSSGRMPPKPVVISTIVSTGLTSRIAADYGVEVIDVLTGFKYIAEKIAEFEIARDRNFVFGFEESYGYLADTFVRDKDGVIAAVLASILLKFAIGTHGSVVGLLAFLYRTYGMFMEYGKSFTLKGAEGAGRIKALMESLRKRPPERIGGGRVTAVRDYLARKAFLVPEGREEEMSGLPRSDVLQFITDDGVTVSVRPSGTEPKIKFYFALREPFKGSIARSKASLDRRYADLSRELFSSLGLS